jgi:hypothetical protein
MCRCKSWIKDGKTAWKYWSESIAPKPSKQASHEKCSSGEVTAERILEISLLVESWFRKKKASLKELQSLPGKLHFISFQRYYDGK